MGFTNVEADRRVLDCLRDATGSQHQRLEQRFNAIELLADPETRPATIKRYATFYSSAHIGLGKWLAPLEGLDFQKRARAWKTLQFLGYNLCPSARFSEPADQYEALGALYVIEGS